MCGGHHRWCERLWNFCCPHFQKKKWHRNKELTAVELEPGTPGSEITELPTKPQGSWRVQVIEMAIRLWFLFLDGFFLFIFYWFFFILYFVCFGKILSQLEAASSVLPRIETFARCPRVVPSAAPRALRSGNALRFLCSVEPRTQLLILT